MPDSFRKILPDPDLKNSINELFSRSSILSQTIYISILFLLAVLSVAMAFVNIPVYVRARGIIRPSMEIKQILAPVHGIISEINTIENQLIKKDQMIVQMESEKENLQINILVDELYTIRLWLADLSVLLSDDPGPKTLCTEKYRIDSQLLTQQMHHLNLKIDRADKDYQRNKNLFDQKFISLKELEEHEYQCKSLMEEKKRLHSEKQKQWTNEQNEYVLKENSLVNEINGISFFLEKSVIRAPVAGIIQGIRNKYTGEYCAAGSIICRLIPDTGLVTEILISPKDIGFITPGQTVRLLIDSYDYRYWGALQARCTSISSDVEIIDNQALFRVLCSLQSPAFLEYHNSRVLPGTGMTLTAQFLVTEKNAWQLLRDEVYAIVADAPRDNKE